MLAGDSSRASSSVRQAITCARVTVRNSSGRVRLRNFANSLTSIVYARRVFSLVKLASHSSSGGTSASCSNCAGVRPSLYNGVNSFIRLSPFIDLKHDNGFYHVINPRKDKLLTILIISFVAFDSFKCYADLRTKEQTHGNHDS